MKKRIQETPSLRWGIAAACAFLTLYAAMDYQWIFGFRAGSLLAFMGLVMLYGRALPFLQGRLARFSLLGGAVFAACQAVGEVMQAAQPMLDIPYLFVCFFPFYTALIATALVLLDRLDAKSPDDAPTGGRIRRFFTWLLSGEGKSFFALWGFIALLWLPFYVVSFPGLATTDTLHQMSMGLGQAEMTTHHPPIHSWWLGACMRLGRALFGTYGAGVGIATTMQFLLMSLLLAGTLRYMARLSIRFGWRGATLALYVLSPMYGWYAVTLWKDVWLGGFCLLFLLCGVDIVRRRSEFFHSPGRVALFALSILGMILSKNNGVYIFVLAALALLIALRGVRRQIAAALAAGLVCTGLITGPLYGALGVKKGSIREALSLPLLQIAFVVRNAEPEIALEDKALIAELLDNYEDLHELYDRNISDGVKNGFNDEAFAADRGKFLALYVRLGLQQPKLYLRAALEHTYGYYFTDGVFGATAVTNYTGFIREYADYFGEVDSMRGQYAEPFAGVIEWVRTTTGMERHVPIVGMFYSVGFCFCALLFCGLRVWYKRQHRRMLALSVPVALWLTCLASPVNGDMRYGFAAVLAAPFLLGYMLDGRAKVEAQP